MGGLIAARNARSDPSIVDSAPEGVPHSASWLVSTEGGGMPKDLVRSTRPRIDAVMSLLSLTLGSSNGSTPSSAAATTVAISHL